MTLLLATACGGTEPGASDSGGSTVELDADCAEQPVLTWENFGDGFLTENCQACHASTSTDRRGAPAGVVFDTYGDAMAHRNRILARSAGEDATMPPQGGVSEADRERLAIWLTCWE